MDWRDIPSLAALRAFEAAARLGSLSKAAAELNVTHAAIAQHVRTLETHLQTPLLGRAGRGVAPTADGGLLAADLSAGFAQIAGGVRSVKSRSEERPLAVTLTPSFAENWLMPRLSDFWAKHPGITVSLTPDNNVVDLRRDGFDIGIRYGAGDWTGLSSEFLVPADFVVVVAPSLKTDDHQPETVADLADVPWFFVGFHEASRRWAMDVGLDPTRTPTQEVATMQMALAAVRAGAGATVVSDPLIAQDVAEGRLRRIVRQSSDAMGYHIVTQPGVVSPRLRKFIGWLKEAA